MYFSLLMCVLAFIAGVNPKNIVIIVGNNSTDDPTQVFRPQSVTASKGDIVYFNFTFGNHTATQSTFASPCVPAHDTNITVNGFDSSFRDAGNGTAITNLPVTVTDSDTTIWFFDSNTCSQGGVGGININDSTLETLDGFRRNAIRLNGTKPSTTPSNTKTDAATAAAPTRSSSNAVHSTLSFDAFVVSSTLFFVALLL